MSAKDYKVDDKMKSRALGHVLYEIQQLIDCGPLLIDPNPVVQRCILESRLIHTRCIHEFFRLNRSIRKGEELDDVIAPDFGFEEISPLKKVHVDRINKHLSHLTYSREDPPDWPFQETWNPLIDLCIKFLVHLLRWLDAPSDLLPKYKERIEKALLDARNPRSPIEGLFPGVMPSTTTTAPPEWLSRIRTQECDTQAEPYDE